MTVRRPPARRSHCVVAGLVALWLLGASFPVGASTPRFATRGATERVLFEEPIKAKRVETVRLDFDVDNLVIDQILAGGAAVRLGCSVRTGVKGVKLAVDGELRLPGGAGVQIPRVKERTDRDGTAVIVYTIPGTIPLGGTLGVVLDIDPKGGKRIQDLSASCGLIVQGQ